MIVTITRSPSSESFTAHVDGELVADFTFVEHGVAGTREGEATVRSMAEAFGAEIVEA